MLIQVRAMKYGGTVEQYLVAFTELRAFLDYVRSSFLSIRACSLEHDKLPDFEDAARLVRKLDRYENYLSVSDLYVFISLDADCSWEINLYEKSVLTHTFSNDPRMSNLRHVFRYVLNDATYGQKFRVAYNVYGSRTKLLSVPCHIEFAKLAQEELRNTSAIEKVTIRKAEYAKRVKSV